MGEQSPVRTVYSYQEKSYIRLGESFYTIRVFLEEVGGSQYSGEADDVWVC